MPASIVAGAIIDRRRVLLGHRSPDREWYPNVWDLPGGHVARGEASADALARELREELGIVVQAQHPFTRLCTTDFEMDVFLVTGWRGTPANLAPEEHDAIAWFTVEELTGLEMAHETLTPFLRNVLQGRVG